MPKTTQQLNRILIAVAKTEVENFIKDNFKNEGFAGEKWKKRSAKNRSDRNNPTQNRALLIGESRQLFPSIKVEIAGKSTLRIVSSVPYAKIHNEGGTINHPGGTPYIITSNTAGRARGRRARLRSFGDKQAVFLKKDGNYPENTKFTKPHKIEIPQRQFIGKSSKLDERIKKALDREVKGFFKTAFK